MVGAELIGEYCWSVEHLLNRVIDGTVRALAAAHELPAAGDPGRGRAARAAGGRRQAGQRHSRADGGSGSSWAGAVAPVESDAARRQRRRHRSAARDGARWRAGARRPAAPQGASASTDWMLVRTTPLSLSICRRPMPACGPSRHAGGPRSGRCDAAGTVPGGRPCPPSPAPLAMDPVLLDILSREVAVHLGTIREFVAKAGGGRLPAAARAYFPRLPHAPRQPDDGWRECRRGSRGAAERPHGRAVHGATAGGRGRSLPPPAKSPRSWPASSSSCGRRSRLYGADTPDIEAAIRGAHRAPCMTCWCRPGSGQPRCRLSRWIPVRRRCRCRC